MSKPDIKPLSHRQMYAIDLWLEDGCKSKARAIREAGYAECVASQPHKVFGSPRVLDELEKRGLNAYGVCEAPKAIGLDKVIPPEPIQQFDLSKIPKEEILILKRKLAELPDDLPPSLKWSASHTSTEGMDAMLGTVKEWAIDSPSSFSSM